MCSFYKRLKYKASSASGVFIIEFALTAGVFFMLLFVLYELCFMLSIKNGLMNGSFYATRLGITKSTRANVRAAFSTAFNKFSYKPFVANDLKFTSYSTLSNRNALINGTNNSVGTTGRTVVYSSTTAHTYLTPYLSNGAAQGILGYNMTVINEPF